MAVSACEIRDLLMPGLQGVVGQYSQWPSMWAQVFEDAEPRIVASLEEATPPSIPVALAMGVAVAVIKNPTVSRRGLFWWW